MKKKEKDIFHPAFKDLTVKTKTSPKIISESDHKQPDINEVEQGDEYYFLDAMSDVKPLLGDKAKIVQSRVANIRPSHPAPDDEQEAMAHLHDLVKGSIEMDITFSDEYMKGSVKGVSPRLMKRLKKGEFPVQDYIDLHGFTKQEAEKEVRDFLLKSHKNSLRCVLIVHGRGLNSPDSFPILKERMPIWLNRGSVKKIVLAFVTAKPYDGGTGAIYVLLRKR